MPQHDSRINRRENGTYKAVLASKDPVVLLAEANADNLFLLSIILEQFSVVCFTASGINRLLTLARTCSPDLILSSLYFPDGSGLEAAREIRQSSSNPYLSMIAVTGRTSSDDREMCLKYGFNEHVSKPYDIRKLEQLIQSYLCHSCRV